VKAVTFTQFMRPDGRQVEVLTDMPDEVADLAAALQSRGYLFEIEVLTTGHVNADISDPGDEDRILGAAFVPNGPDVPGALETMIRKAAMAAGMEVTA
jgi:hypothetical protein